MSVHSDKYTYDATCPKCDAAYARHGEYRAALARLAAYAGLDVDDERSPSHTAYAIINELEQPDRPEPVDPANVRIGDIVDYEHKPGYETCQIVGKVDETLDTEFGISLRIHGHWWNAAPSMATIRVLHRAEPEPDPAAVEALASTVHIALATVGPPEEDDDWRKWSGRIANLLAREGYVVSTDA